MTRTQSLRSSSSGFTVMELLVAGSLSLVVVGLTLLTTTMNNRVFKYDMKRGQLSQNLQSALDLLGANIREAGENLSGTVPAILVTNGSGAPDTFVMKRNLMDEILKVCVDIPNGSAVADINFADSSTEPGCSHGDNQFNYSAWEDFRTTEGGSVEAFIYNTATKQGEFFEYTGETDDGTNLTLQTVSGSWSNDYLVGGSAVYMMEELQFQLSGDMLQVVWNQDTGNALNIVDSLTDFQVTVHMQDGSSQTDFTSADDWTQIQVIEVALTGEDTFAGETISITRSARYYPRNILSN